MPVAIIIIVGVVVLAIALIGIIWSFLLLFPFYIFVGVAVFLLWRGKQKEASTASLVAREAERQRLFNEQEMLAWEATFTSEQRKPHNEREFRRVDDPRDPLQK